MYYMIGGYNSSERWLFPTSVGRTLILYRQGTISTCIENVDVYIMISVLKHDFKVVLTNDSYYTY